VSKSNRNGGYAMKFASAIITDRELAQSEAKADAGQGEGESAATRDVSHLTQALSAQVQFGLAGESGEMLSVDMLVVFLSAQFAQDAAEIVAQLQETLAPHTLIGCTAEGVITSDQEIQDQPAIALVAAHLPNVTVTPFKLQSLSVDAWESILSGADVFREALSLPPDRPDPKLFVVLADPFSTPLEPILDVFNIVFPNVPVVGGLASGAQFAGGNAMIYNDGIEHFGLVGLALSGAIDIDVIVSQGCRPIGQPYKVTASNENMIFSLNGGVPIKQIRSMLSELPPTDQALVHNGLYIGRAIYDRELVEQNETVLGRGDFLIRGVLDSDAKTGAIMIGDRITDGELVQFHLRDAQTAQEDLDLMLTTQAFSDAPDGALLFSCNGRGLRLYDYPNGDISVIQGALAQPNPVQLAGFFCAGEIGPIGGRNFLHGHTASLVLFRAADPELPE